MTTNIVPTAFHPSLTDEHQQRRPSMQGQDVVPIIDRDIVEGSPLCQVGILMDPRKVSTPHIHETAHIYVHLVHAMSSGVLTLFGDELDQEVWLYPGGTLWIPPGVPHVAVYPHDVEVHRTPITALAVETRTVDHWTTDVKALPELWPTLHRQLRRRGMQDYVDYPPELNFGSGNPALGIHDDGTGCFPSNPSGR